MTAAEKMNIFLSYAPQDAEWAQSFARALKQRGLRVWLTESDVRLGESVREALEHALRNSDVVVTLLGSGSLATPSVFFELGVALGMGKTFVPIVPKDFQGPLPFNLRTRRYLIRSSPEKTAEELSEALLAA
jgi:hypothetical protein